MGVNRVLVETTDRKRILERYRRKWEDNIKTNLQGVGWGHILYPVQDRDS
jgi:hypothetical protein